MAKPRTLLLSAGGIRSLVALASLQSAAEPDQLTLLHVADSRPLGPVRLEHVHRQARHFDIPRVLHVPLPAPARSETSPTPSGEPRPLFTPQMLLIAAATAIELDAHRVVWPIQANGMYPLAARVAEQLVLVQHLAQFDRETLPRFETPLLDLTDRQLIELGDQLECPWALAWSCTANDAAPCRACPGCRRRKAGFEAAGLIDPTEKQPARQAG